MSKENHPIILQVCLTASKNRLMVNKKEIKFAGFVEASIKKMQGRKNFHPVFSSQYKQELIGDPFPIKLEIKKNNID